MILLDDILQTLKNWWSDDPFTQSAAAAFYAVLSLPGLLIIVVATAALFMEGARVETTIFNHIENIMGASTAENMNDIIDNTQRGDRDIKALSVGIATLIFGATGLFVQLQRSFNHIWDLNAKPVKIRFKMIKSRLLSLGLILITGFLLVITMTMTALITLLSEWMATFMPDVVLFLIQAINLVIALCMTSFLFALMYKILPDKFVGFRNALYGGTFAAILFKIGEYGINFYFETAKPHTAFGAAGSVILLMLWVYFACMTIFIGAEMTKHLQEKKGHDL